VSINFVSICRVGLEGDVNANVGEEDGEDWMDDEPQDVVRQRGDVGGGVPSGDSSDSGLGDGDESVQSDIDEFEEAIVGPGEVPLDDVEQHPCCLQQIMTNAERSSGVEQMHPVPGVIRDTVIRGLLNERYTAKVEETEVGLNNDRFHLPEGVRQKPWEASNNDIVLLNEKLDNLSWLLPKRLAGNRIRLLLDVTASKKLSHYNLLAGPIGKFPHLFQYQDICSFIYNLRAFTSTLNH
jgi:hypothetical protein